MKKIPTIFVRDFANKGAITQEWHPDCLWVRDGEGRATVKIDGTSCLFHEDKLWKRREIKEGQAFPAGFIMADKDEETGKTVGWVAVGDGPDDQWHREALQAIQAEKEGPFSLLATKPLVNGQTYELIGPKVNGGREKSTYHALVLHGAQTLLDDPRDFSSLAVWLNSNVVEGIVWHHPDGRMGKIKRRDLGLRW